LTQDESQVQKLNFKNDCGFQKSNRTSFVLAQKVFDVIATFTFSSSGSHFSGVEKAMKKVKCPIMYYALNPVKIFHCQNIKPHFPSYAKFFVWKIASHFNVTSRN